MKLYFFEKLEVLNLLVTATDLEYITEETLLLHRPLIEEIGNKINALRESKLKRDR